MANTRWETNTADVINTRTGDEHQGEWPISGVRPILGTWSIPGGVANTRCETNTGDMVYTRGEWPTSGVRPILATPQYWTPT